MFKVPKLFLRFSHNFVLKNNYVTKFSPLATTASAPSPPPPPAAPPPAAADAKLPRPVRGEPGKVELGFIPVEWGLFFRPKTGVSGFYTFVVSFGTFLISKEYYVMEHEYYGGLSIGLLWYFAVKHIGPGLSSWLDKQIDEYEAEWNKSRVVERKMYQDSIAYEEFAQQSMDQSLFVYVVKYENVLLQLEASYRERLMMAYIAVTDRLDFQYKKDMLLNRYVQTNMVDWVLKEVHKSLTPEYLAQYLDYCFMVLSQMAGKQAIAA